LFVARCHSPYLRRARHRPVRTGNTRSGLDTIPVRFGIGPRGGVVRRSGIGTRRRRGGGREDGSMRWGFFATDRRWQ
jgi:hypothetical protein